MSKVWSKLAKMDGKFIKALNSKAGNTFFDVAIGVGMTWIGYCFGRMFERCVGYQHMRDSFDALATELKPGAAALWKGYATRLIGEEDEE